MIVIHGGRKSFGSPPVWFVMAQTDCSPRANGLFAPSQRIVRPQLNGLFALVQRIVRRGQQAGQTAHRRARPSLLEKRMENSRLRNRKLIFHKCLPSHPLFFWKWEGEFAAQEQKVDSQDFVRKPSILSLKTFHETL